MARIKGKKAFYEVMAESRSKPVYEKIPADQTGEQTGQDNQNASMPAHQKITLWPRKPKLFQFNAGRIEFSMPYPLAIALVLTAVLTALVAFRLGQLNIQAQTPGSTQQGRADMSANQSAPVVKARSTQSAPSQPRVAEPIKAMGGNRIVIKQFSRRRDLEPVQKFFAENGIQTEIVGRSSGFFLVTKNTYNNPNRPGTNGFEARKKIIETGAKYKAPSGYESFAPRLFSDAYGEKVN